MQIVLLILYTRSGCCLCEGLEERLRSTPLNTLNPPINLEVIDIDKADLPERIRNRYDLSVPVMVLSLKEKNLMIELPRVSPRIKEKELFLWMQKNINKILYSCQ